MIIDVKVIPNAKKREVIRDGPGLKVKLTSPPVEDRANQELVEYLSHLLQVRKSEVKILRGDKNRRKVVSIPIDEQSLEAILQKKATFTKS
jgi:uncharacterized protein